MRDVPGARGRSLIITSVFSVTRKPSEQEGWGKKFWGYGRYIIFLFISMCCKWDSVTRSESLVWMSY